MLKSNRSNIEELFKNAETQKELLPSDHVWDRLEHRLDKNEISKKSKLYRSLFIAASVIGLIAVIGWWSEGRKAFYMTDLSKEYLVNDLRDYKDHSVYYLKDVSRLNESLNFNRQSENKRNESIN